MSQTALPLRVLVDHISVEAFAAGGRGAASQLVYYNASLGLPWPTTPPKAFVFGGAAGRAGLSVEATAWEMGCGWNSTA